MRDLKSICLALSAWSGLMLFIGLAVGEQVALDSSEKEITELSIELTKLEIKKLKGSSNGS